MIFIPLESVHSVAPSEGIFFSRAMRPAGSLKSMSFVIAAGSFASLARTRVLYVFSFWRKVFSEMAATSGLLV